VFDAGLIPLDHVRDDFLDHQGCAGQVDPDDQVPVLTRHASNLAGLAALADPKAVTDDPSVVDQAVEPAHLLGSPRNEARNVVLVGDVELSLVDAVGEGGQGFLVDVAHRDLSACGEELFGEVLSKPGGAAGDDDFELVELHRGGFLLGEAAAMQAGRD